MGASNGPLPDHPRVSGEHIDTDPTVQIAMGSSPRERGARLLHHVVGDLDRIIPA